MRKSTFRDTVTQRLVRAMAKALGFGGQSNSGEKTTGVVWFQVSLPLEDFSADPFMTDSKIKLGPSIAYTLRRKCIPIALLSTISFPSQTTKPAGAVFTPDLPGRATAALRRHNCRKGLYAPISLHNESRVNPHLRPRHVTPSGGCRFRGQAVWETGMPPSVGPRQSRGKSGWKVTCMSLGGERGFSNQAVNFRNRAGVIISIPRNGFNISRSESPVTI